MKEKPDLGRNLFRQDQAYPATARHMRDVHIPLNLRIIDITAEHTWVDTPEELAAMRRSHSEFVAASPNRVAIFAEGSGHYISKDRRYAKGLSVRPPIEMQRTVSNLLLSCPWSGLNFAHSAAVQNNRVQNPPRCAEVGTRTAPFPMCALCIVWPWDVVPDPSVLQILTLCNHN